MVVAGYLQYRFNYSSVVVYFFGIIQSFNNKRFSQPEQGDKISNAGRNHFHDLFLFLFMKKIILASQSPRRKQLLEWAEVPFEVVVKETDETFPDGLKAEEAAIFIAKQKALAVQSLVPVDSIILAADTVVVLKGRIIGKPLNREEAIRILTDLSGQKHVVITGVVILKGEIKITFADATDVYFHELSIEQIEFYVDKYQPYDKAGAYAIQEWIGVVGIKSVKGDFYNVMGLPVSRVVKELNKLIS
jgi:septum formation protein